MVTETGTLSHQDHCAILAELLPACAANSCRKVLVDLRRLDTARNSTIDCFSFGKLMSQQLRGTRVALVLPGIPKARADVQFTATTAANRGARTGEFDTVEAARQWLDEKE